MKYLFIQLLNNLFIYTYIALICIFFDNPFFRHYGFKFVY